VPDKSSDIAKRIILKCISESLTVEQACGEAGKSLKSYEYYRSTDRTWADMVDRTRLGLKDKIFASGDVHDIGFVEFRQRFLHSRTFPHQQNIVDVIEGREPSWLHPSMKFEPGLAANRVLINIPPNHAKSITITVDYVTWQVARNPNFRVLIVSQTQQLAADFLYAIKNRLTHPVYQDLQNAYAAGVGFNSKSASWQATRVTFGDELRQSSEKDPNIEAVGIGGQIYGKRADMIIVDDAVTLKNANEFEKQIRWLTQDVRSRLNPTGKLIIIGTRVASVDLYRELRSEDRYPGGQVPWKYLAMPALLEANEDPDKWVTLWPASDAPFDGQLESDLNADGLYPRWSGRNLYNERQAMDAATWALVYQQQDVSENAAFDQVCVRGSIDAMRKSGPLVAGHPGHPRDLSGFTFIAGLDPAMVGDTAAICYGIDRATSKRYIVDAIKITRPSPAAIRNLIFDWTSIYPISEWVVEKNAFQSFLTQDEGIRMHLANRGIQFKEHHTGSNKWDSGFGVAAMSTLFGTKQADGKHHRDNLIHLPSDQTENVKALLEQLITWTPTTKGKTDMVMALWFKLKTDTPLWTTSGWKTMGTVKDGDFVATAEGSAAQVVGLTPIFKEPVFKVTMSDGTYLVATAEHKWWVTPKTFANKRLEPRWVMTSELLSPEFKDSLIAIPKPIELPEQDLLIDPYVLGVWLGDGDARQATIYAHKDDKPFMRANIEATGCKTSDHSNDKSFGVTGIRGKLVELNLLNNKHIPEMYLNGSLQQRLSLLQGLMDTDGTVNPGRSRSYFANVNPNLIEGVDFLAKSLGFRTNIQWYESKENVMVMGKLCNTQRYARVLFTPSSDTLNPFRLPRKAERVAVFKNTRPRNYLVVKSVEPDGEADTRCITVDHDSHVFLAGKDLIPTGNCEIRAREMLNYGKFATHHLRNPFLSKQELGKRVVYNLDEIFAEQNRTVF